MFHLLFADAETGPAQTGPWLDRGAAMQLVQSGRLPDEEPFLELEKDPTR